MTTRTVCTMLSGYLALLAASVCQAQPQQPDPHVALELGKLRGTWRVVSVSENGKVADKEFEHVRFRFSDNRLTLTDKSGSPIRRSDGKLEERHFTINLAATPKSITLAISAKHQSLGIYELTGDTLKLCTAEPGAERPTEFKASPGVIFVLLKREAK